MKTISLSLFFTLIIFNVNAQSNQKNAVSNNAEVYTVVEQPAEYNGGMPELVKFIQSNLHYPDSAKNNKISGKCFLKFIVQEDGSIDNVQILKGVPNCNECDQEAMRVVKAMPNWLPAKTNGSTVKCYYNLPISFKS